jgi:hypothetical protein
MNPVCEELARRAIALGDLYKAGDFINYIKACEGSEYDRLMDKVQRLGSGAGLLKTIDMYWNKFVKDVLVGFDEDKAVEQEDDYDEIPESSQADDIAEAARIKAFQKEMAAAWGDELDE